MVKKPAPRIALRQVKLYLEMPGADCFGIRNIPTSAVGLFRVTCQSGLARRWQVCLVVRYSYQWRMLTGRTRIAVLKSCEKLSGVIWMAWMPERYFSR